MHSNFYSNARPFGGFGRSSAKSSATEIDRHLAKTKMGFVGSVLFRSNGLPKEICVVHTPSFKQIFFGIETAATEEEENDDREKENRDPEPSPSMSKEEKMRIKQTLLDFYIRNDLVRDSMINVQTEREKTWFCKVGVPACVLTEPEIVRLNTVPSPYRREVPMDMQEHVRRFHRGNADEECAVRNAFDLQNKYYSVLQHNIVFNTKVANYSDVDWMEGGMWGGGLGGSGGGGASMWGGGLGGGGGSGGGLFGGGSGGMFGGGLQSNRRGSGDASDYLGHRRFKPLDPCEL